MGNEFAVGGYVVAVYGGDVLVCGDCGCDSGVVGDGAKQEGRDVEDGEAIWGDVCGSGDYVGD